MGEGWKRGGERGGESIGRQRKRREERNEEDGEMEENGGKERGKACDVEGRDLRRVREECKEEGRSVP